MAYISMEKMENLGVNIRFNAILAPQSPSKSFD